jgi:hypothetical protein
MRQTARTSPPLRDESLLDLDAPLESVTRLVAAAPREIPDAPGVANAHPTMPVPSFYLFLAEHNEDEMAAGLAAHLEDLGDEANDALDREPANDDPLRVGPSTGTFSVVVPAQPASPVPSAPSVSSISSTFLPDASPDSDSLFDLLASIARVPYLRRSPREIPRGNIHHAEACVLALIDGRTSIESVLDASSLPIPRVLRILNDLLQREIIGLKG